MNFLDENLKRRSILLTMTIAVQVKAKQAILITTAGLQKFEKAVVNKPFKEILYML